jgi:hypothetical protein
LSCFLAALAVVITPNGRLVRSNWSSHLTAINTS